MCSKAASGSPAALLDWNNNFSTDPIKTSVFHCFHLPKAFFGEQKMITRKSSPARSAKKTRMATIVGRISPGPFTYCRVSTDDLCGRCLVPGKGRFTEEKLDTFGGYGVIEVPNFQNCSNSSAKTVTSIMSRYQSIGGRCDEDALSTTFAGCLSPSLKL